MILLTRKAVMLVGAVRQYNGGLTAEQFLYYEMRIVAKLYIQGKSADEIGGSMNE